MQIEFEIAFNKINAEELREKLAKEGFKNIKEKTAMKRVVFKHPSNPDAFARIRDEGSKITCTYKQIDDANAIHGVKELETEVKDFDTMKGIFEAMGVKAKSFQETYREIRDFNDELEVVIDWRPGLEPFCEVEGPSEESVKALVEKLGFDRNEGIFGAVDQIYLKELGLEPDYINKLESITFDNPPKK